MITKLLQRSARRYLARHTSYVIWITGSIGKTTCRTILESTLRTLTPELRIESSKKNFNTESWLPLSILGIHKRPSSTVGKLLTTSRAVWKGLFWSKHYDVLLAEFGIDGPWDMDVHLQTCTPDIAILTGIDLVHAEWLISPDITIIEKMKLINAAKEITLIHQWTFNSVEDELTTEVDQLTFALHPSEANEADIWFHHRMIHQDQDILTTSFDVDEENDTITKITTNLLSYSDAWYLSLWVQIAQILERRLTTPLTLTNHETITVEIQPGRFSILPWQYGSVIIDSSYNASPKSMKKILNDTIKVRNQFYQDLDMIYVLGDMRELGQFSEKEHRKLMAQVAQSADEVYLVGPEMSQYGTDELIKLWYNQDHIHSSLSSRVLWEQLVENIKQREKRSLVLFKWSQNTIFTEESIKPLLKKGQDHKKTLCRQDSDWMQTKVQFFNSLNELT